MTLAQSVTPIIIFWAMIGGLGASLLLPAMQSLIHGNFEGAAQKRVYALVGASAAIAAAVARCSAVSSRPSCRGASASLLEVVIIGVVLSGIGRVRDVPYTGTRHIDLVGAVLSVLGMGGLVLGILVWQEGGESVAALLVVGAVALGSFGYWLIHRKREGKPALIDPDLFRSKMFRLGITGQMLQQIALGGAMIALPIFLQMVLEYNAMQTGPSMAPSRSRCSAWRSSPASGRAHADRAASSGWASRSWRSAWRCSSRSCLAATPAGTSSSRW